MRLIRKIIKIFDKEYFIEFNIWNHGITGKHCFFINLRNNITNPDVLNIRYSNFGNEASFEGSSYNPYIEYNSKDIKRVFVNYITSGTKDSITMWLIKQQV